ncbi:hypothetical protein pb186bvf_013354 [Paramecium bursaria]
MQYFQDKRDFTLYRWNDKKIYDSYQNQQLDVNRLEILEWVSKLNFKQSQEVFSFTYPEEVKKILIQYNKSDAKKDKKFFNSVNIMTINTLFDTIAIRGIDFVQERLLNQMHLEYQQITIKRNNNSHYVDFKQVLIVKGEQPMIDIIKFLERSIITRFIEQKYNINLTFCIDIKQPFALSEQCNSYKLNEAFKIYREKIYESQDKRKNEYDLLRQFNQLIFPKNLYPEQIQNQLCEKINNEQIKKKMIANQSQLKINYFVNINGQIYEHIVWSIMLRQIELEREEQRKKERNLNKNFQQQPYNSPKKKKSKSKKIEEEQEVIQFIKQIQMNIIDRVIQIQNELDDINCEQCLNDNQTTANSNSVTSENSSETDMKEQQKFHFDQSLLNQSKKFSLKKQVQQKQKTITQQSTPIKQKILKTPKIRYDIDQFAQKLFINSSIYKNAKQICINRIQFLLQDLYQLQIFLFGSFVTNLDLEDSDVDISIMGIRQLHHCQIVDFFQAMNQKLKQMPWISNSRLIIGNVPVLKLELNPKIPFLEGEMRINQNYYLYNLNQQDASKIIQIDLTYYVYDYYNPYTQHLGFESTKLLQEWIYCFDGYSQIFIILKYLLKQKNLNDSYYGGISSYCLAIMLAAIYRQYEQPVQDKRQILLDFLNKFGNNFDPQLEAIDVDPNHQNSFMRLELSPCLPPLSVYSPLGHTLISQKAIKIGEIIEEFRNLYQFLIKPNKIESYFIK